MSISSLISDSIKNDKYFYIGLIIMSIISIVLFMKVGSISLSLGIIWGFICIYCCYYKMYKGENPFGIIPVSKILSPFSSLTNIF